MGDSKTALTALKTVQAYRNQALVDETATSSYDPHLSGVSGTSSNATQSASSLNSPQVAQVSLT
jgi:hypothetical protein